MDFRPRNGSSVGLPTLTLLGLLLAPVRSETSPIALENARPGARDWGLRNPATRGEIEGYASSASTSPGESLTLHVSTTSQRFDVEIFRVGWYGGRGARRIAEIRSLPGGRRDPPSPRAADGLLACAWPASCRLGIGPDWVTGVYLARLTAADDRKQSYIPFIVRETEARRASLLFQCSVTTWQAYNNWGGKSLYDFNSDGGRRALRVSFDRPFASGPGAWEGLGAGEFLTVAHAPRPSGWEYPMVRWLERHGYDLAYATNIDVHQDSALLVGRRALLIVGHDEYWSRAMRDRIEAARNRGTHLGIFAANVGYWQVRLEPGPLGGRDRVLFCAKEAELDSVYETEGDAELTVRFRDLHPRRPEVTLGGIMMGAERIEADWVPIEEQRGHWLFAGTGVARGRTRAIPGLLGYEVDRSFADDARFSGWSPPGLTVLARAAVEPPEGPSTVAETTIYAAPSGAFVFAAGTMQWSWGLDDWGAPARRPKRRHPDVEGITKNALEAFLRGSGRAPGPRSPR